VAVVDQLPPFIFWRDDDTNIETGRVDTKRLALVSPGIGRKNANDIAGVLRPSLSDRDTTLASLSYGDDGMDPREAAEAIRRSGCRELILVGHSIGGGFNTQVVEALRGDIESGQIAKPKLILLSSPHDGSNVQNGMAGLLSKVPLGLITDTIADTVAFGGPNNVSPHLEGSQLDFAVGYDGSAAARIVDLIDSALYIGDANPDGVIDTPRAARGFKAAWGDKLTAKLVPDLGHPDPAKNAFQADVYNHDIAEWLAAS
jgi:hypothetical protein